MGSTSQPSISTSQPPFSTSAASSSGTLTKPIIDLQALINLQSAYADNLLEYGTSVDANYNLVDLTKKLQGMNDKFKTSQDSSNELILQQDKVNNILELEKERLDKRKSIIDYSIVGKNRMIQLNDSYRKRQYAFMKIIIFIIVALIVFYILRLMSINLTFIPEGIYYILFIAFISGSLMYIVMLLSDIYSRDAMNFDEISSDMLINPAIGLTPFPNTTKSPMGTTKPVVGAAGATCSATDINNAAEKLLASRGGKQGFETMNYLEDKIKPYSKNTGKYSVIE
jgi:hypothetical protein